MAVRSAHKFWLAIVLFSRILYFLGRMSELFRLATPRDILEKGCISGKCVVTGIVPWVCPRWNRQSSRPSKSESEYKLRRGYAI